jgi:hypothetical protein
MYKSIRSRLTQAAARMFASLSGPAFRNKTGSRRRVPITYRPCLESMEQRELPATLVIPWTSVPTFMATFQVTTPDGHSVQGTHKPVVGGNFLGTLLNFGTNGNTQLKASYCVRIDQTIYVPMTYNQATVASDGTVYGTSVPNAGAVSWLLTHFGATATTPEQQDALQAAIWRTEYGKGFEFDGVDNNSALSGINATIAPIYKAELAALGNNTAPVSSVFWIEPGANPDSSPGQGLVASNLPLNPVTLGDLSPKLWMVNQPGYNGTIAVNGGSWGYTNLKVTGLPPELHPSLSGNLITISGTPAHSGPISFTVTLQDGTGAPGTRSYTLTIEPASYHLTVSPATLPDGTAGQSYRATMSAAGGSGNDRFTLTSGALPPGLQLLTTGVVSGQATPAAGTYHFTVQATDTTLAGLTGTQPCTLTIRPAAVFKFVVSAPSTATTGVGFPVTLTAVDQYGNRVTGYTGTVTLTSSDNQAVSPASVPLTQGTGSTSVTLYKAAAVQLKAAAGASTGTSNYINVNWDPEVKKLLDQEGKNLTNLTHGRITTVGPSTPLYNCYAYAADSKNPESIGWVAGKEGAPPGAQTIVHVNTLADLLAFFKQHGWNLVGTGLTPPALPQGTEMVAIYSLNGSATHAALVTPGGVYAKMGQLGTFRFDSVDQMEGGTFGYPSWWLAKSP